MFRIVIRNESWVYYNHLESKTESMDWKHTCYPRSKQPKVIRGSKKRMATVFWDFEGFILINYLLKANNMNADYYADILDRLRNPVKRKQRGKL